MKLKLIIIKYILGRFNYNVHEYVNKIPTLIFLYGFLWAFFRVVNEVNTHFSTSYFDNKVAIIFSNVMFIFQTLILIFLEKEIKWFYLFCNFLKVQITKKELEINLSCKMQILIL